MANRIIGIRYRTEASLAGPKLVTMMYAWRGYMDSWTTWLPTEADEKRYIEKDLLAGDQVVIQTGKRSDPMAYTIAFRGLKLGVTVWRITPNAFGPYLAGHEREEEPKTLVNTFRFRKHLFTEVTRKDVEKYRAKNKLDQGGFGF
jgi:hypothetical protein